MTRSRRSALVVGLVAVLALVAGGVAVAIRPAHVVAGQAAPASSESVPVIGDPGVTVADPSSESGPPATTPAVTPPSGEPDGAIGAETAGDPYYPDSGNGGYDVQSYLVSFTFDPTERELAATTTITATVTEPTKLGRFSFDLQDTMTVSAATVNGAAAAVSQHDGKLVITPATGIATGQAMTVVIDYTGRPGPITGGTANLGDGGWYTTNSGGVAVMGEPYSASSWYPVNEHPTDRASFGVVARVPTGWQVISNGLPNTSDVPTAPDGFTTFVWDEPSPMASYLSVLYIEKFTMTTATTSGGIPVINAYGPGADTFRTVGDKTAQYLDFLASAFGPYPFESSGGIFMSDNVGFALETQTRPIYSGFADESTVVHELAHQWFGDAVVVNRWADICLNECFASYAEWLWAEHNGEDLDQAYLSYVGGVAEQPGFWSDPLFDMGAGNEFGSVYSKGPLALHALRVEIGDEKFTEVLLGWIEEQSGKAASWSQFEELVSRVAGTDESAFLKAWFRDSGRPADQYLYPGRLRR